jgi:hypothetical protein
MRLLVAPGQACYVGGRGALCRMPFFTIDSWYEERPGPSFLIVDPPQGLAFDPPSSFGRPSSTFDVGPEMRVYVYPYDLARRIGQRDE